MLKTTRLKAVSIFTGAGGLDIGFERAGFQVLSAVELHPKYCETIIANQANKIQINNSSHYYFEGTKVINEDIHNISSNQLVPKGIEVDCLFGGPPCQAFSSAGKQDSIFDERGMLIYEYLRILKEMQPKTFLFENVRGIVTARGANSEPGEILLGLLNLFKDAGYSCKVQLLNSADYGSYQRRIRCFIIGSRIAAAPDFPNPTHSEKDSFVSLFPEENRQKWCTLGEFLDKYSDKEEKNWIRPTEKMAELLKDIPSGKGLKSAGRKEATRPNGHWGYRQGTFIADLATPARTVTGSSSQDWIRLEDGTLRRLTLKEVAGLQGFPNEWVLCGTTADQFQQIGNAVPTIFGEAIGEVIKNYLLGDYQNYPSSNEIVIPANIRSNIRYTKVDNIKNGAYRAKKYTSEGHITNSR